MPMTFVGCDGASVRIGVPTRFLRDRVNALYGDRLRSLWTEEDDDVQEIDLVVVTTVAGQRTPDPRRTQANRNASTAPVGEHAARDGRAHAGDRKSTRLNSRH